MYTSQRARIVWNNQYSDWFEINSGVKQGGVLSPVLFCVYIDDLLIALKSTGYGCFVGHMFTGVLAYADDLVLLAPSQHAMRQKCLGYVKVMLASMICCLMQVSPRVLSAVQSLVIILIYIVLCPVFTRAT